MTAAEGKKRKVLIVSYWFPPTNTSGAVRIGKFAKYLPEFGWEPIVLTSDSPRDLPPTLPVEVDDANIVRTPYFALSNSVSRILVDNKDASPAAQTGQPSKTGLNWRNIVLNTMRLMSPIYTLPVIDKLLFEPMGWYRYAVRTGSELVGKNKIDVIFSTYGPSVPHLVASRLHKQTRMPWVAEFRDPWSLNAYTRKTQPFQFLEEQWEKKTMKNCDLLVSVSKLWAEKLEAFHSKKTMVIANGFDEEDYREDMPLTSKFTITYTGGIYPGKRDPTRLFQAIAELRREGKMSPDDLEVRFLGSNVAKTLSPLVQEYRLPEFVKMYGFVSFKESIKRQMESTVLLLLSWDDPRDQGTLTAKIFEYMGARRPTLALAFKGGEIDKLLWESGCGILANAVNEIKNILMKWLGEFRQYGKIVSYYRPDNEVIKKYTRREQAKKLAETFDSVLTQH